MNRTDLLVAATHHCDVSGVERVGGWLNPNLDRLDELDPDLVVTADALQAELRDDLRERGHAVHHVDATTLSEVVASFESLGRAVGCPETSARLTSEARACLDRVREAVAGRDRPVVYCEEWSDPPMAAGNWVPEAVETAGGRYPFVDSGERSREVSVAEVEVAGPEHVFLHVCGHGDSVDPATVAERDWDLPAVESGQVHVIDDSLLNQPSPKLIDGIEEVAATLHPDTSFE
jgi:iron complex transport system substrate-binding protein